MKEEQSKQDVRALFHFFSRNIREQLLALPLEADGMEEVRLRVSAPLYYIYKNKEYTAGSGFRVSREDVDETLQCAARSSLYGFSLLAGTGLRSTGWSKSVQPALSHIFIREKHTKLYCYMLRRFQIGRASCRERV